MKQFKNEVANTTTTDNDAVFSPVYTKLDGIQFHNATGMLQCPVQLLLSRLQVSGYLNNQRTPVGSSYDDIHLFSVLSDTLRAWLQWRRQLITLLTVQTWWGKRERVRERDRRKKRKKETEKIQTERDKKGKREKGIKRNIRNNAEVERTSFFVAVRIRISREWKNYWPCCPNIFVQTKSLEPPRKWEIDCLLDLDAKEEGGWERNTRCYFQHHLANVQIKARAIVSFKTGGSLQPTFQQISSLRLSTGPAAGSIHCWCPVWQTALQEPHHQQIKELFRLL